jgi:hypothetical protein
LNSANNLTGTLDTVRQLCNLTDIPLGNGLFQLLDITVRGFDKLPENLTNLNSG